MVPGVYVWAVAIIHPSASQYWRKTDPYGMSGESREAPQSRLARSLRADV